MGSKTSCNAGLFLFYNRVFPNLYTLYLCASPPYILLPADPSIPAQSRLGEGPNHLLIHHSAFEPSAFWQKKEVQHFFPCSSVLPVLLTGSPRWMQPAELIAPCYWRSASLCDTHAVQPYGCPLGEEFD